jgi:uncharacterized membrane protein
MPQANDGATGDKTPSMEDKLELFYSKHLIKIWLLIILLPIIVISLGCVLLPEVFYDQFIWRYFWGTIEADAREKSYGDVTEAYNSVNTIVYAIILIVVIYWLYKMFKKFKIDLDFKFFIAIIPFIIIGSVARALEDAELFFAPVVYLFIAPIIYIFIGVVVIGLILVGVGIKRYIKRNRLKNSFIFMAWTFGFLDVFYLLTYIGFNNQFSYMLNPIVPVLISLIILVGYWKYSKLISDFEISGYLFVIGIWFLSINLIVLFQWQTIPSWTEAYNAANPDKDLQLQPFAFILVIALTILCTFLVFIIAKLLFKKYPAVAPFAAAINLLLFFGHFLDASATFIAIDYYGYVEKHVLPTFMIDVFHTAAIMYLLKALIIIIVVYFMDILYKKDFQNNPILAGLVKIAILVLGLGPGLRDILRLGIGV